VITSFRTSTFSRGLGACLLFGQFHARFPRALVTSGETGNFGERFCLRTTGRPEALRVVADRCNDSPSSGLS